MKSVIEILTYNFTVEGECELWYLKWLQNQLNSALSGGKYRISFNVTISEPGPYFKKTTTRSIRKLWHVCDIETSEEGQRTTLENRLREMVKMQKEKRIPYCFAYSNLSFELWMILHKKDCNGHYNKPGDYLRSINNAFGTSFESIRSFKKEENFQECLKKLTLRDVFNAIEREDFILQNCEDDVLPMRKVGKYTYYTNNPAVTVGNMIKDILKECKLM